MPYNFTYLCVHVHYIQHIKQCKFSNCIFLNNSYHCNAKLIKRNIYTRYLPKPKLLYVRYIPCNYMTQWVYQITVPLHNWLSLFTAFVINSAWKHEASLACADAKQLYCKVLSMTKTNHILTSSTYLHVYIPYIYTGIYSYTVAICNLGSSWLDKLSQKLEQYNNYDNQVQSFVSSATASLLLWPSFTVSTGYTIYSSLWNYLNDTTTSLFGQNSFKIKL